MYVHTRSQEGIRIYYDVCICIYIYIPPGRTFIQSFIGEISNFRLTAYLGLI